MPGLWGSPSGVFLLFLGGLFRVSLTSGSWRKWGVKCPLTFGRGVQAEEQQLCGSDFPKGLALLLDSDAEWGLTGCFRRLDGRGATALSTVGTGKVIILL